MKRLSNSTTKAVTVRLSQADYVDLLSMAEQNNASIADTMRKAWREYQDQEREADERCRQTQELKHYVFECLSLTKNWDPVQRQKAIQRLSNRLSQTIEVDK